MVAILNQKIPVFQSTLPREERLFGFGIRVIISIFQSTLPREERRPCSRHSLRILLFQSTLPREERHTSRFISLLLTLYFNPRSHERSDSWLRYMVQKIAISIHAPTRGATCIVYNCCRHRIFQSTLPREERQQYCTKNLFIFIQYRQ